MSKIFISYRRDDSKDVVGRIYDHLARQFGASSLFKDVDSIPLGGDFRGIIGKSVQSCDVVLAVIGKHWLSLTDEAGVRRLNDPDDFVRLEIEAGLNRGIPVIPILVGDATMPRAKDLPDSLSKLAFQNGLSVRADPDFTNDMRKLIASLQGIVKRPRRFVGARSLGLAVGLLILAVVGYYVVRPQSETDSVAPLATTDAPAQPRFIGALDGIYMQTEREFPNRLDMQERDGSLTLLKGNCAFFGDVRQVDDYWQVIAKGQDGICDMIDDPFIGKEVGRITPIKGKMSNSGRVLQAVVNFKIGSLSGESGIYEFKYADLQDMRESLRN